MKSTHAGFVTAIRERLAARKLSARAAASNAIDWDQETLWRTCTMLTDLESAFRSLNSELGLRPVYHQTQGRADGHLFITVPAYQLVQTVRSRLRQHGEASSWATLGK